MRIELYPGLERKGFLIYPRHHGEGGVEKARPHSAVKREDRTRKLFHELDKGEVDLEKVRDLIREGANVNATDENGLTPLHIVVGYGYDEAAILLIDNQANINAKDVQGDTPLQRAVERENLGLVKLLINNGADVSVRDNVNRTPLEWAKFFLLQEVYRSPNNLGKIIKCLEAATGS